MAKPQRDDFPQRIITKLRDRVAHRCSNPDCRVPTSGPHHEDPEKSVSVGEAAHICAAAPGGPRYDTTMVKEQRKGIKNAIWLCAICADKIDKDVKAYPVSLLLQWKISAERSATEEIGNKLPSKNDGVDLVTAVLQGSPKSLCLNALHNVSIASTKSLESLDPRFRIKASYNDSLTEFTLLAKEDLTCQLTVVGGYKEEFDQKFEKLIKHGESLEIDARAIRLGGSRLFEFITSDIKMDKFILSNSIKKSAVQKLWLKSHATHEVFYLDDIHGEICFGDESFSFVGSAYGGLLELKYSNVFLSEKSGRLTFTITVDYKKWDAKPINALPYFGKIQQLFSYLSSGCALSTKLEIDGLEMFIANDPDYKPTDDYNFFLVYCDYISLAVSVSNRLNKTVRHKSEIGYSRETHEFLYLIDKTLNGESIYSNDYNATLTCTFIAEDDLVNIKLITDTSEPRPLKMAQDFGRTLTLFGESIQLPRSYLVLTSVIPLIQQSIVDLRPGDEVEVEWIAQEDCQFIAGFNFDTE